MRRHITLLAAIALAVLTGCASGAGTVPAGHRLGAVNTYLPVICETVTLDNTTRTSTARQTSPSDTFGFDVITTGTWSGTYGLQESNDNVTWIDVTLPTTPPASTGSPQSFGLSYEGGWPWAWERMKFAGSGSTGSALVCLQLKG